MMFMLWRHVCISWWNGNYRVSIVLFYHLTKAIAEGPMQLSLPRVLASMAHCNKIKGLRCIGTYVPYSGQKQDLFRAGVTTRFFFFKQKKKEKKQGSVFLGPDLNPNTNTNTNPVPHVYWLLRRTHTLYCLMCATSGFMFIHTELISALNKSHMCLLL